MDKDFYNVLFIADIVGKPGMKVFEAYADHLVNSYLPDIIIANGENVANGKGLTEPLARRMHNRGVHVITSGNHIWNKRDFRDYMDDTDTILRPANYPAETPGMGSMIFNSNAGKIGVLNLQGRTFMYPIDCPFKRSLEEVQKLRKETDIIIVDFHAEASAEKIALAYYLDGKVSAVIGTHTHVQTADEQILPKGCAFITDAGMTGATESVIGMEINTAIERFIKGIPGRFVLAQNKLRINGVHIKIDKNGTAKAIERIKHPKGS
ncbi:MAG: TIGR00282 family metallophosphoesterase [candidate division KSB1 bacterium]|nr:TIGR00282 family metallophosphoesterase [candidate division KSB1 bacterium]